MGKYQDRVSEIGKILGREFQLVTTYRNHNGRKVFIIVADITPVGHSRATKANAWRSAAAELQQFLDGKKSDIYINRNKFIVYDSDEPTNIVPVLPFISPFFFLSPSPSNQQMENSNVG